MPSRPKKTKVSEEQRFFLKTITVKVLSETPGEVRLESLPALTQIGPMVLHTYAQSEKEVSGRQMAKLLTAAGSDPGYFQLSDDGGPADF